MTAITLTACNSKVERIEPKDDVTEETKDETINGYTKEELEESALPEDIFDEDDSNTNSQKTKDETSSELTEEDAENALKDITENYTGGSGPIILPDDVFE